MAFFQRSRPFGCLLLFLACWLHGTPALGQHFTDCLHRSSNATVLVPSDITAELAGNGLAPGDEIALFTADSTCAGVGTWDGSNLAIAAAGANSQETGGYESDEPLHFRVWDASAALTFDVDVTYEPCDENDTLCRDDGRYQTDAFYVLASMTASGTVETADLQLEATTDSLRTTPGRDTTFALILSNNGPYDARRLAITAASPADLTVVSATPSRGDFDAATSTWALDTLATEAADTLTVTVSADRAGSYAFTAEISASLLSDPDSTPDNDADGEDDRSVVVMHVESPEAECAASTRIHDDLIRLPTEPGAVTLTVGNPDGLVGVHFVDGDDRPALKNFTVATANADFTSADGVRWRYNGPASDAPTTVTFTLTQADRNRPEAQYEAEAWSVCASPNPHITRFAPSPVFTFDDDPPEVALQGNAPNPFRWQTTIHFTLSRTAKVHLAMYDVLGRKVATLVNDVLPGGPHTIRWNGRSKDGRSVTSGVYLYRLRVADNVYTGRMNVVR